MDWQIECEGVWKIFGPNPEAALQAIRSEGLGKEEAQQRFNSVIGVSNASLQIRRGELFCIMGLSGSGKSTLLRHVNRLIDPTAGKIMVGGVDISLLDRAGIARLRSKTIGMVFQHMALWPHRTIQDNVAYGLEVQGVGKRKRRAVAAQALEQVKLQGWESHYPDELSGGMQQRVGLARALASDPDILLMDEPFSALDPLIRNELQGQFLELSSTMKKTTLFITHDLEEAIRLGDRVAIMKDGVIVQLGTPQEIILNPSNDYVAEFVRTMSQVRFITAESVMTRLADVAPTPNDMELSTYVLPTANLDQIIDAVQIAKGPIGVRDGEGVIGRIEPVALLSAMKDRLG
ncbi:glycine betaine/L-proline ABC transporter ATP-binding protein [Limibacillus sp. MBR-115]|jgi:glycine betaine/proline transport system ATP-binding protein|uniref:quaternary amine ABC transporter ATP-binding protein n=1 Tax=Limibacillus sp. MBR-115 TaxID=3156465 RepID=UPI0033951FB0